MRQLVRRSVMAVFLAIASGGASIAGAQVPARTAIAACSLAPNALFYFDRTSGGSSLVGGVALRGAFLGSVEASLDNRSLVVTDQFGVWLVDQFAGSTTFIAFNQPSAASWGCHGERDDFYTFSADGGVYRHATGYARRTLFAMTGSGHLNGGCWDGTTGGVVALSFVGTNNVHFIDPNGNVQRSVALGASGLSSCDWNPFDGSIMVSGFSSAQWPGLWRVHRNNTVTPVVTPGPAWLQTVNSVEVLETGPEEYLVTEYGAAPTHLGTVTRRGSARQLFSAGLNWGPADACYIGHRKLWPAGQWAAGGVGAFYCNLPRYAGQRFRLAASFGHAPGIPLGPVGTVHLVPDPLFDLSLKGLGIFNNFSGTIGPSGSPTLPPFVQIPVGLRGSGVRIFFGGVTFDNTGITGVMNACGVTIR